MSYDEGSSNVWSLPCAEELFVDLDSNNLLFRLWLIHSLVFWFSVQANVQINLIDFVAVILLLGVVAFLLRRPMGKFVLIGIEILHTMGGPLLIY